MKVLKSLAEETNNGLIIFVLFTVEQELSGKLESVCT